MPCNILILNSGSSSIKFQLFECAGTRHRLASGRIERLGTSLSQLIATLGPTDEIQLPVGDRTHGEAVQMLLDLLRQRVVLSSLNAVGHRIVHGGMRFSASVKIDASAIEDLRTLVPMAPVHLPGSIACIKAIQKSASDCPQFACFDTAFHHSLPRVAQILPIPRSYEARGFRRYGFHGLSYTYLSEELARLSTPDPFPRRVVMAHLGAGCSLAAIRDGRCIDTSMSFTPSAGLMMATRSGDLDPGLLLYLMRTDRLNADQLDELVNQQSGLLGVAETSSDLRDLLSKESTDVRAAEAIDMFCYSIRKGIGSFAAALEGLDTIVFSAGIGENSPQIRARVCSGLAHLGVQLDQSKNAANASVISSVNSQVTVRVIHTDEEAMVLRDVLRLMDESVGRSVNCDVTTT